MPSISATIPPFESGQELSARMLELLRKAVLQNRISVQPPLSATLTPDGTNIYLTLVVHRVCLTTTTISAAVGGTGAYGTGHANVLLLKSDGTRKNTGVAITVYNPSTVAIPTATEVQVKRVDDLWLIDYESCV